MDKYKHIILAVELDNKTDSKLIKTALEIVQQTKASVSLVHAIEHVSAYGGSYGISMAYEVEKILVQNAEKDMRALGTKINVPVERQIVKFGSAKDLILEEADKQKADLIIVGSHGRHGVQILLGSTANAVLHRAKCDVLSVRLHE